MYIRAIDHLPPLMKKVCKAQNLFLLRLARLQEWTVKQICAMSQCGGDSRKDDARAGDHYQ